ncbi:MAG: hypothetical protein Q7Q71_06785 [Verrucomicrobiota bacterium JB023]|nr:hypothetical protein [Verrucomicrobiota bacterium JB023]
MTPAPIRLLRILAFLLCLSSLARGQSTLYQEVFDPKTRTSLRVEAMSDQLPPSGFIPVRATATNGEKLPITWNFDFISRDYYYGDTTNQMTSSFELSCQPGRTTTSEFMVPLVTCFHGASHNATASLNVTIKARPPFGNGYGSLSSTGYDESKPSILISETLYTPNKGTLDTASWPRISHMSNFTFGAQFEPSRLSEDWRAYVGHDVMMLTAADWNDVSPGGQAAIKKWVRLGGNLIVYSPQATDNIESLALADDADGKTSLRQTWGLIDVLPLEVGNKLDPAKTISFLTSSMRGQTNLQEYVDDYSHSWQLKTEFGERSFNPTLLILILVGFGILVGPINLFVFAKSGQRHKLFITTPIISLATSLLLVVIILLQDGFGGKGQRLTLMEVRPDINSAFIKQQQICRTGVLLSTSFPVRRNAFVTPVFLDESRWSRVKRTNQGGAGRYQLSPLSSQEVEHSGDWFKSRSEYAHVIRSVQPTRGRIEQASPNGPPAITSSFDFPLETIYYRDRSGGYWKGSNLQSGKTLQLKMTSKQEYDKMLGQLVKRIGGRDGAQLWELGQRQGHFLGLTEDAAQVETLESISWKKDETIVTGPVITS